MKAAILDFDGIIADTLQLNFEVKKAAFLPYGVVLSRQEFIDIWISPEGGKEGTPYFVKLKGLSVDPEESKKAQRERFKRLYNERASLMPGALHLIRLLRKNRIPLGIVSSNYKPNIEIFLKKFGLGNDFEFIIGAAECKLHKPFPDPYIAAVKRFGLLPAEVLVVEDSDTGVASAKKAGCKVVAVSNSFTKGEDFSKADLVLKSLQEIDESVLSQF